jgi:hypothetical protein
MTWEKINYATSVTGHESMKKQAKESRLAFARSCARRSLADHLPPANPATGTGSVADQTGGSARRLIASPASANTAVDKSVDVLRISTDWEKQNAKSCSRGLACVETAEWIRSLNR